MAELQEKQDWDRHKHLPDRIKLPHAFAAVPLLAEPKRLDAGAWTDHFVPQHYRGEWSVVPLRAPGGANHPILRITSPPGCNDWQETEYLTLCPEIAKVLTLLRAPLGAVRLMRLGPESSILRHSDHDLSADYGQVRLHVPLTTNPQVDFRVNDSTVTMLPGECWYLRLSDPHSVDNRGPTERIHLVIDAMVNDWLAELLVRAAGDGTF